MPLSRAETLIHKLISNTLSGEELSELLEGIASGKEEQHYSDVLEIYFNRLLQAHHAQGSNTSGKDADL